MKDDPTTFPMEDGIPAKDSPAESVMEPVRKTPPSTPEPAKQAPPRQALVKQQTPENLAMVIKSHIQGDFYNRVMEANAFGLNLEAEKGFLMQVIKRSDALLNCEPTSILEAFYNQVMSGLSLNPALKFSAIMPYKGKAKFEPQYQGLLHILYQSGSILKAEGDWVHDGDTFKMINREITHVPKFPRSGKLMLAYVIFHLPSGLKYTEYMEKAEIDKIMARSPSGNNGPWKTDYERMGLKTVVRRAFNYMPKVVNTQVLSILSTIEEESYDTTYTEVKSNSRKSMFEDENTKSNDNTQVIPV